MMPPDSAQSTQRVQPRTPHPLEALIEDMGLTDQPRLRDSWPEARGVLDAPTPDKAQAARLKRLAADLLDLRPARQRELVAAFSPLRIDLNRLRTTVVDVGVTVLRPRLVQVHFDGQQWPLRLFEEEGVDGGGAEPPAPPIQLQAALFARAQKAGPAESLVVRVHLDALSGAALEAADAMPWERLLLGADGSPVAQHLVRVIASGPVPDIPKSIESVAFFAQSKPETSEPERAAVEAAWPGRITHDTLHGELAHIHAHGTAGFVQGLEPSDVSAWAVVVNACQGARSGGHVRSLVRKGRVAHAMGFPDNVTASVTETVARVWHHAVADAQDDLRRSVWRAGVMVRAALGAQPAAWLWRHYTSKRVNSLR